MKNRLKEFWELLKATFKQFSSRNPFNNSIVISYYTIFSLPGLLVIIINSVGYFYSKQEIKSKVITQVQSVMGKDTAKDIEGIFQRASENEGSVISSIIGIATLLFGATGVFYQLQQMMNVIWKVKPQVKTKQKILEIVRDRFFSFGLILVVGFLLLISLFISAILGAVGTWVTSHFSEAFNFLFRMLDILVSLGVITLLFAAMFKFLPDVKLRWRDVWLGAILTAVLFVVAKFALGLYFGNSNPASSYGAAGSVILIMLWVSYAGMILLFGAEFTHVYVCREGRVAEPMGYAEEDKGDDDKAEGEKKDIC